MSDKICGKPVVENGVVVARCEAHGNLEVICENATLRASLAEAQEKVEALEKAVDDIASLTLRPDGHYGHICGGFDHAKYKVSAADKLCVAIAKANALSRPSPQATPKCVTEGCVRKPHDDDHHLRANGSAWYSKPQAAPKPTSAVPGVCGGCVDGDPSPGGHVCREPQATPKPPPPPTRAIPQGGKEPQATPSEPKQPPCSTCGKDLQTLKDFVAHRCLGDGKKPQATAGKECGTDEDSEQDRPGAWPVR